MKNVDVKGTNCFSVFTVLRWRVMQLIRVMAIEIAKTDFDWTQTASLRWCCKYKRFTATYMETLAWDLYYCTWVEMRKSKSNNFHVDCPLSIYHRMARITLWSRLTRERFIKDCLVLVHEKDWKMCAFEGRRPNKVHHLIAPTIFIRISGFTPLNIWQKWQNNSSRTKSMFNLNNSILCLNYKIKALSMYIYFQSCYFVKQI